MQIHKAHTPNFDARPLGAKPRQIIVHYTSLAGPDEVFAHFANPAAKVSSHYYILACGKIFQFVQDADRAWHAGKSCWRGQQSLNDTSIGIELDNRGHNRGYTDYPIEQMRSFILLTLSLQRRYGVSPAAVLGHSDVSPDRKADPGEKFWWQALAKMGIGVWPDAHPIPDLSVSIVAAQTMLRRVGYNCPQTGALDSQTQHVLTAFKRHYAPEDLHTSEPLPLLTRSRLAGMPQLRGLRSPKREMSAVMPIGLALA